MTTECTQLVFGFHPQKRPFDERSGSFSSGEGSDRRICSMSVLTAGRAITICTSVTYFSEAISMTKRYFTSPLRRRS